MQNYFREDSEFREFKEFREFRDIHCKFIKLPKLPKPPIIGYRFRHPQGERSVGSSLIGVFKGS